MQTVRAHLLYRTATRRQGCDSTSCQAAGEALFSHTPSLPLQAQEDQRARGSMPMHYRVLPLHDSKSPPAYPLLSPLAHAHLSSLEHAQLSPHKHALLSPPAHAPLTSLLQLHQPRASAPLQHQLRPVGNTPVHTQVPIAHSPPRGTFEQHQPQQQQQSFSGERHSHMGCHLAQQQTRSLLHSIPHLQTQQEILRSSATECAMTAQGPAK